FFRIYIVKPLSLEFSAAGTISSRNAAYWNSGDIYLTSTTPALTETKYYMRTNRCYSYALMPLNIQYHLMNDRKLQPYFGVGGGMITRNYDVEYSYVDRAANKTTGFANNSWSDITSFIQLEQGITYRTNKHWQFNESVYYQHEYEGRRNNV